MYAPGGKSATERPAKCPEVDPERRSMARNHRHASREAMDSLPHLFPKHLLSLLGNLGLYIAATATAH